MRLPHSRTLVTLASVFLAVCIAIVGSLNVSAGEGPGLVCTTNGGTWVGQNSITGTCTYPAGHPVAVQNCGVGSSLTQTYNGGSLTSQSCSTPLATNDGPGYGGCGTEVRGPLEQPRTISLCNHKNGQVTFPIGDCALKCTITNGLPSLPAKKLPGNAVATLYVRVVDPGGVPGDDPYTVCFSIEDLDLDPPAIYRFVSGAWVQISSWVRGNNHICAMGDSDGSYYLGQPPHNANG